MSIRYTLSVPSNAEGLRQVQQLPGSAGAFWQEDDHTFHQIDPVTGVEYITTPRASTAEANSILLAGTLTAAQILTLNSVPVLFIPAPGANKLVVLENLVTQFLHATAFANGGVVSAQYNSLSVNILSSTLPVATFTGAVDVIATFGPAQTASGIIGVVNKGIEFKAATADFITGTGTLKWAAKYRIVNLT